jgi:hypothetical protein
MRNARLITTGKCLPPELLRFIYSCGSLLLGRVRLRSGALYDTKLGFRAD